MLENGVPISVAYNDSGAFHKRLLEKQFDSRIEGQVPRKGSIILYNEIIKWQERRLSRPHRGCGIVCDFETEDLIFIDKAIMPGYFIKTSFPKTDFLYGLIKYVELRELIYKKGTAYDDLDISRLAEKIKKLVI